MKRWPLLLLLLAAGCFRPNDERIRPDSKGHPEALRPITADMITEASARRMAAAAPEEIDRELGK